jgi:hypothetical protein
MRSDSTLGMFVDGISAITQYCIEWSLATLSQRLSRVVNGTAHFQQAVAATTITPSLDNGAVQELTFSQTTVTLTAPPGHSSLFSSGTVTIYARSNTGVSTTLTVTGGTHYAGGLSTIALDDSTWKRIVFTRLRSGSVLVEVSLFA